MKQWRHSYFADYTVFDVTKDEEISSAINDQQQHQFVMWSPTEHILLWVTNEKNIYYQSDLTNSDSAIQVTDNGGWCIENPRILGTVYNGSADKCIYNGVPEWNYEEEGLSSDFGSRSAIFWAPDSSVFTFVAFDVSDIESLQYSVYPDKLAASSPDEVDMDSFEQYPRINTIKYAKTADKIVKTKFYIAKIVQNKKDMSPPFELNKIPDGLKFELGIGKEQSQENRYFARLAWSANSSWFVMTWLSRAATQAKSLACLVDSTDVSKTTCSQVGREDGGVAGSWTDGNYANFT